MKLEELRRQLAERSETASTETAPATRKPYKLRPEGCETVEVVTECATCGQRRRFDIPLVRGSTISVLCERCYTRTVHDLERVRVP